MKVNIELTDTFGGEANYSWVKRETYEFDKQPSRYKLIRLAKKFAGLTGMFCEVEDYCDSYTIRPMYANAPCIICFVNIEY